MCAVDWRIYMLIELKQSVKSIALEIFIQNKDLIIIIYNQNFDYNYLSILFILIINIYWINKGSNGYMYFSRNNNNMCEIASYAIYPTLNQKASFADIPSYYDFNCSRGVTVQISFSLMANTFLLLLLNLFLG